MAKPKIRFKGYTDDWEQRKLGEIASSFEYGLNAAAKEYDGENKYIRITDIDDNTHEFLTYNLTSPDIDLTDVENYKLAEGDILFARTGASVGKSYIYRDSDGLVYYAGFLIRARIREEYDAEFVFQSTLTDKYNKYIAVTSQRSGQPGVNAQEYSEFEIRVPEKEEQTKIGTYFHNLDHLITLHQRKCEETKKLKKYMLQKMFPQNGQTVPEIRFAGFTDAWEQRKLGKLVDRVTRKNQDLVSELPLTISAQYGLIDQNEFFDKRVASKDVSGYYLIENGEFAYNKSTSTDAPWGAVKRLDRYENGVLSTLYIVFGIKENNPVDSDFLVSYYSTNLWHKGIHEIAAEGARNHGLLNIAPADFFETELTMPQDIEEQKKIGKYFEELERLITLHQCKCHLLLKLLHNDWEQRKLGDLVGIYDGVHQTPDYQDSGIMFLSVENIATLKSEKYISEEAFERDYNVYPEKGDILMTRIGDVGTTNVVETAEKVAFYVSLALLKPNGIDSYFLSNAMKTNDFQKGLRERTLVTAIPQKINKDEIGKINIFITNNDEEQKKIGAYFSSLDHLITLHHRKYIYILKSP